MIVGVLKRLSVLMRNPVFHRAVLAICILSFVATNFAHAGQYLDDCIGKAVASVEAIVGSGSDTDSPSKAAPDLDVCTGCHAAALHLTLNYVSMPEHVAETTGGPPQSLSSRRPPADLRPPIA